MTNSVFLERDGMFFTATQAAEYDEKKKLTPQDEEILKEYKNKLAAMSLDDLKALEDEIAK